MDRFNDDNSNYKRNRVSNNQNQTELMTKIRYIEGIINTNTNDTENLKTAVDEMKTVLNDLKHDIGIQNQKRIQLEYRIEQLEKNIEKLDKKEGKNRDKSRDTIEKVMLALLGGLVTYVLNTPSE